MAAVARGIDETSNSVQLPVNGFFGKTFYFYNLFSQSATLPLYLFVCESTFFNKTEGVVSHIFKTWSKLDCALSFFAKSVLWTIKFES